MWVPKQYKIEDKKVIEEFVNSVGLATLVTNDVDYPVATHFPLALAHDANDTQFLRGHIAKANPQSEILAKEPNALVIFQSPVQHYISASWYEEPHASTWNYMAVHFYGKVKVLDKEQLWHSVSRLVKKYEKNDDSSVLLENLPQKIQNILKATIGFEIKIDKVEAAFKLSQNQSEQNLKNIISALLVLDTPLSKMMAEAIQKENKLK